jgi:glucosyl-3-phosphoglycerate synthase
VDLGGNFEHKHQHLGIDPVTGREDAKSGLMRMAREVTAALLSRLWDELGFAAESDKLRRLPDSYRHTARALLKRYAHEALFNHLHDVSAEETLLVELFARMVRDVVDEGREAQASISRLPPWNELKRFAPSLVQRFASGGVG